MDICSAVQCESASVATVRRWDCRVALYTNSQDFSTGGNKITPFFSGNTTQSMHPGVSSVVGINLELLESSRWKRCWIHGMPVHTPIRKSSALQCDYTSLASVSAYINQSKQCVVPLRTWICCRQSAGRSLMVHWSLQVPFVTLFSYPLRLRATSPTAIRACGESATCRTADKHVLAAHMCAIFPWPGTVSMAMHACGLTAKSGVAAQCTVTAEAARVGDFTEALGTGTTSRGNRTQSSAAHSFSDIRYFSAARSSHGQV